MSLKEELIELSKKVEDFNKVETVSEIHGTIELGLNITDVEIPYIFQCEALHPGEYKGFIIEQSDIVQAQNTIFMEDGVYKNYELNKDHNNSRKAGSSVDDLVGEVIDAKYDYAKNSYDLKCAVYDKPTALKIANKILKFVSLRINPRRVEYKNGKKYAKDLVFEEVSLVRAPGDPNAKIL